MKLITELLNLREAEVADEEEDQPKKKPTKTRTKNPDLNFGPRMDHLPAGRTGRRDPTRSAPSQDIAGREETRNATRGIQMTPDALRHLSDLHQNMPQGDEEDTPADIPEPRDPETLPKLISHDVTAAGYLNPKFHLVANLPGNMSSAIRQLGKSLFRTFTTTPTDKISMIGNVMGGGPNSTREINAVAQYLKDHGQDLGHGEIDFSNIMPGYSAQIRHYVANHIHYMLVKDMMGEYIYSWPENTSVGANTLKKLK